MRTLVLLLLAAYFFPLESYEVSSCLDCEPSHTCFPSSAFTFQCRCSVNNFDSECSLINPCQTADCGGVPNVCQTLRPGVHRCRCAKAFFTNEARLSCTACLKCVAGEHVRTPCSEFLDAKCEVCAEGYYSDSVNADNCTVCPNGKWTDATTLHTHCDSECPSGHECAWGVKTECQPGTFAPNGRSACDVCAPQYYQTSSSQSSCVLCPENTATVESVPTNARLFHDELTDCQCREGYTGVDGGPCLACSPGFFKDIPGDSPCEVCLPGRYSDVGASDCLDCTPGYMCPGNGTISPCREGTYAPSGASTCTPCDPGFWSGLCANSCEACGDGYFPNPEHSKCLPCPAGTFGVGPVEACTPCSVGKFSSAGASNCTTCNNGSYPNPEKSGCLLCPAGTAAVGPVETCPSCNGGEFSGIGATSCTYCNAGSYSSAGASECTQCDIGQYSEAHASECTDCGDGREATANATSCQLCALGYYRLKGVASDCQPCPPGTYTPIFGAACIPCDEGYIILSDETSCSSCPSGSTSNIDHTKCVACPTGQFKDSDGPCTGCPSGSTTVNSALYVDHDDLSDCFCSTPGHFINPQSNTCVDGTRVFCTKSKYKGNFLVEENICIDEAHNAGLHAAVSFYPFAYDTTKREHSLLRWGDIRVYCPCINDCVLW